MNFANSFEFKQASTIAAHAFAFGNVATRWSDDVYRLYQATLDCAPDLEGFVNWSTRLANGMSYQEVAQGFVGSPSFRRPMQIWTIQALSCCSIKMCWTVRGMTRGWPTGPPVWRTA